MYSRQPARREQRPERRQDALLLGGERRDVALAPQPLDVGMAPHDTRCRARDIRQDAIERLAVPPARRRARVADRRADRRAGEAQPREVLAHPLDPAGVAVDGQQVDVGEFGDMCEVLPPGAAHASSTRMPSRTPSSGAASCAPASCTENAPSAKPGSSVTGRGVVTMRPAAPTGTVATSAAAIAAATASRVVARRLTRSVSGGRSLPTSRMRCQSCGWSASTRPIHQRGYDQRATGLAATAARLSVSRSRR